MTNKNKGFWIIGLGILGGAFIFQKINAQPLDSGDSGGDNENWTANRPSVQSPANAGGGGDINYNITLGGESSGFNSLNEVLNTGGTKKEAIISSKSPVVIRSLDYSKSKKTGLNEVSGGEFEGGAFNQGQSIITKKMSLTQKIDAQKSMPYGFGLEGLSSFEKSLANAQRWGGF